MTGSQAPAGYMEANFVPGYQLGHYLVLDLVRQDGAEEVYRAKDARTDRNVLLNLAQSRAGSDHFTRFVQKWRTGALFCHPNVLAVYDFGWHDGRPYMVTELLEGDTLRSLLDAGPLAPAQAAGLAMQIADGLNAAHRVGVVHGDIRPENVCVTLRGEVKIQNFSPTRYVGETLELVEQNARGSGTRAIPITSVCYLSPEQVSARTVDHRTDLFSLGAVLYEMVMGVSPYRRQSPIETLLAIVQDDLPEPRTDDPAVLQVIDRIVRRCVEKEPSERFQSALGLLYKLELVLPSLRSAAGSAGLHAAQDDAIAFVGGFFGSRHSS
jgi:serine/threonine-protein kinase